MKSLILACDIPKASRYVSHARVDEIAAEVAKAYRGLNAGGFGLVGLEEFVRNLLEKEVDWRPIREPDNRVCFASIDSHRITLNENHRPLFNSKPFLLRSCISHEIGHELLGHVDLLRQNESQANLFDSAPAAEFKFHDSAWRRFDLTLEEMQYVKGELARTAWIKEEDREALKMLSDRMEPEWMYYQAEQFASCFLIPKDLLNGYLEEGIDLTRWSTLYRLRDIFEVSISMVAVRLQKLNLIEIDGKQILLVPKENQASISFP